MRLPRHAILAASAFSALAACEKSTRPVADNPPSTASSTPAASTPAASSGPAASDGKPSATEVAMPAREALTPVVTANNAFAFDFWPSVGKAPGNAAFSPTSISVAFAMTWPGAKGETSAQMKKVLRFTAEPPANTATWGALSRALASPSRTLKLRIANRLFGEKTYEFERSFLDSTERAFDAPMERLDFKNAAEAGRVHINGWVSGKTEDRIKDLLPSNALDDKTRIVLVNALYFLADWQDAFDKERTKDEDFFAGGSTKKQAPMMHATRDIALARADGMKMVELPYKRGEAALVVVVPDDKAGLPALERSVTAAKFEAWRSSARLTPVALSLPRFEVTTPSLDLGKELVARGMVDAFDRDKADFTGIANPPLKQDRLFISKVFHKAFVRVDEKGTEAAAATAIVMAKGGGGAPPPPVEVKVDHPFLYFIVDKPSGVILFMGRIDDPTSKGS